jgi:hypothetical protein
MATNNFIEASKKERWALKNIFDKHFKLDKKNWEWEIKYTDPFKYDDYDCVILKYNKGWSIQQRYIVKMKIRETKYPDYLFELKKYNKLKFFLYGDRQSEILYINTTPEGTFVWNISKMEKENKLGKIYGLDAPKQSMAEKREYINKKGFLLKPEDALFKCNWKWDEGEYIQMLREQEMIRRKTNKIMKKGLESFFDSL